MNSFTRISSVVAILFTLTTRAIAQNLNTASPIDFFTNVAGQMLQASSQDWFVRDSADFVATYNVTNAFGITDVPVLVSNQFVYSSAIQRVLQVAANVYDATTTNFYPSVFRPTFNVVLENGYTNVYVNGYEQVFSVSGITDPQLNLPYDVNDLASDLGFGTFTNVNVYGVPWIIGVKKGFPNFNEFSMENIVGINRRLQVTRPTTNSQFGVDFAVFHTNQMYSMIITNSLGVECWNSYGNDYVPASGGLSIVVRDNLSGMLTNDDGMIAVPFNYAIYNTVNPVDWPGILPWNNAVFSMPNTNSFNIPLFTSISIPLNDNYAANSNWWAYRFDDNPPDFVPIPLAPNFFETNITGFPFPDFGLLTTNRLQVFMLDGTNVIDYVQFGGPNNSLNINTNLFNDSAIGNGTTGVWNTNLSTTGVPDGVANQILVSRGELELNTEDGVWHSDPETIPLGGTIPQQQAYFSGFFEPRNIGSAQSSSGSPAATATNLELSVEAPYEPVRFVVQYTTWQANDPLVHCLACDLNYTGESSGELQPGVQTFNYGQTIPILPNLGKLNDHYSPWGGNPVVAVEQQGISSNSNTYNLTIKDPLIYSSDDWNFPDGQMTNLDWIGQVHRGTPWQTIYLKSALPNILTWTNWTGDLNVFDAENFSPGEDWHMASLLVSLLNTNDLRSFFSVNNPNPNDWQGLLNGLTALTNIPDHFDSILISSNSSQASIIANAIQSTRSLQPGQFFSDVGDILETPQLSEQSPFLTGLNATNGISDVNYEIIPSQLLSLLRVDSIGSAGLFNGQRVAQFTGYDNHAYAVEVSSNLVNWASVSTNYPVNGTFSYTNSMTTNTNPQFYRSILLQ
jgi:hypothetical protein